MKKNALPYETTDSSVGGGTAWWLVGWLVGWLAGWWAGWLVEGNVTPKMGQTADTLQGSSHQLFLGTRPGP